MNIQELATAVLEDLPIISCILNNYNLGMVRQWQKLFYGKRYSMTNLRSGAASRRAADDENFTRKLCESVGVDCYAAHIDCIGIAREKGHTVEEAGRRERYRIFDEIAKK